MDKPIILSEWGIPPIEKIYEALSAVIDNRVEVNDNKAIVSSSGNKKRYNIVWDDVSYSSNDNASYWQGYIGYPVIAVLMVQGKISYPEKIAKYFRDVNWNELNKQYKRDYSAVVEFLLSKLYENGVDTNAIKECIAGIYEEVKKFPSEYKYKKSRMFPPR